MLRKTVLCQPRGIPLDCTMYIDCFSPLIYYGFYRIAETRLFNLGYTPARGLVHTRPIIAKVYKYNISKTSTISDGSALIACRKDWLFTCTLFREVSTHVCIPAQTSRSGIRLDTLVAHLSLPSSIWNRQALRQLPWTNQEHLYPLRVQLSCRHCRPACQRASSSKNLTRETYYQA
jgi:hypothetical protein